MSLIDHPEKWIIKMFKFNERETGGENTFFDINGFVSQDVDLNSDELIFGTFKVNAKKYYFTTTSLIICNGKQDRIIIGEVINTNGSFRSGHKKIVVETIDKKKRIILIEDFPYRLQQLFYQLIERHGALSKKSKYQIPEKLKTIFSEISEEDLKKFQLSSDPKSLILILDTMKSTDLFEFHGKMINDFIHPDDEGVLILRLLKNNQTFEVFNSSIDGYNGLLSEKCRESQKLDFNTINKTISQLVVKLNYSIEDYEYNEILGAENIDTINSISKYYSSIEIFSNCGGKVSLLTEYETQ